jgi:hypothetical protein
MSDDESPMERGQTRHLCGAQPSNPSVLLSAGMYTLPHKTPGLMIPDDGHGHGARSATIARPRIALGQHTSSGANMTLRYLPIIVLTSAALAVVGFRLIKARTKANRWAVRARSPVSPMEQQLFGHLLDAFPQCIVLSQVAISQLVSVLPGPDRQAAFNRIGRLVADFVLCSSN